MEDIQHPLVHTLPTPSVFMIWRETVGILHRQLLWQTMVLSRVFLATQFAAVLGMLLQEVVLFPIEVRAEKIQLPQRLALELRLIIPLLMATIKA